MTNKKLNYGAQWTIRLQVLKAAQVCVVWEECVGKAYTEDWKTQVKNKVFQSPRSSQRPHSGVAFVLSLLQNFWSGSLPSTRSTIEAEEEARSPWLAFSPPSPTWNLLPCCLSALARRSALA